MGVQIKACFYDMDDTLVRTGAADVKAYEDVMQLAADVREQVQLSLPARLCMPVYARLMLPLCSLLKHVPVIFTSAGFMTG